jgi:RimJ/RimL family protein N-acetyltransferase
VRQEKSIEISRAKEADLIAIRRLFLEIIREIPYYNDIAKRDESKKYTIPNLKVKLIHDRHSILSARDESGTVVGFLFNHFDDYTIWLDWLAVQKSERKKGIGLKLLTELFRTVKLRGCHKVWCDCRTSNTPSKVALTNAGFRMIAEIRNHWYGQDFILWERFV